IASRACSTTDCVIGDGSATSTPPVSITTKRLPAHSATSSLRSRVTPGVSCTTAARDSVSRLTRVDLPTLGKPTIATVPRRPSAVSVSRVSILANLFIGFILIQGRRNCPPTVFGTDLCGGQVPPSPEQGLSPNGDCPDNGFLGSPLAGSVLSSPNRDCPR